ncbi:hypothetical protein MUK42_04771 [Musa troglodytarum]|uniref:Uncharacterized protein n=1 Tax=Musa troglodytarum TaxID=320322 RepID=A0A9E7GCB8_9LILI|nr:hypothetical protein MUK42_04771 [Musa troglodytarum]
MPFPFLFTSSRSHLPAHDEIPWRVATEQKSLALSMSETRLFVRHFIERKRARNYFKAKKMEKRNMETSQLYLPSASDTSRAALVSVPRRDRVAELRSPTKAYRCGSHGCCLL